MNQMFFGESSSSTSNLPSRAEATNSATRTGPRYLAESCRPKSFKEFLGQESVVEGLLDLLERPALPSVLLWGPPGSGKTSLAKLFCEAARAHWIQLHANDLTSKEVRRLHEEAQSRRIVEGRQTLVFVDEIHRLNRGQQDLLLPGMESGDLVLFAATTEHPGYELQRALLSRFRVFKLSPLSQGSLKSILNQALEHQDFNVTLEPRLQEAIVQSAEGDARLMLAFLDDVTAWALHHNKTQVLLSDLPTHLKDSRPAFSAAPDNERSNLMSAFIKSMRKSQPNAALYWMLRMLEAGESPLAIARRMIVFASEDIGNADPRALPLAISSAQAVEMVGLPECRIPMTQVLMYLASAPKSRRSYEALQSGLQYLESQPSRLVPTNLKNEGVVRIENARSETQANNDFPNFYEPSEVGFEKNIRAFLDWNQKIR